MKGFLDFLGAASCGKINIWKVFPGSHVRMWELDCTEG